MIHNFDQNVPDIPEVVVLYGGIGAEREISIQSGRAIARALEKNFKVEKTILDTEAIPPTIDRRRHLVFPALHGGFGEDGRLQKQLELQRIHYCGSDAAASRLCMDKAATQVIARHLKVSVPKGMAFDAAEPPPIYKIIDKLGASLVIKPVDQGSSVGLHFIEDRAALQVGLSGLHSGKWLIEERIYGRELTVGLLRGRPMGIVEIVTQSGVYDYKAKYILESTDYQFPAKLEPEVEIKLKTQAEKIFKACGCRDFARIDFLLDDKGLYFLEINTLPGLTSKSLFPKSASCPGLNFERMAMELARPAIERFNQSRQ